MRALKERNAYGAIESHELLGDYQTAREIKSDYEKCLNQKESQMKKVKNLGKKNKTFEGTIVAAGWDRMDKMNQSSLFTIDDEDILLEHWGGIKRFLPYLNQKVKISGDIISQDKDGKKVLVKTISRLFGGFTKLLKEVFDEFGNLITPIA